MLPIVPYLCSSFHSFHILIYTAWLHQIALLNCLCICNFIHKNWQRTWTLKESFKPRFTLRFCSKIVEMWALPCLGLPYFQPRVTMGLTSRNSVVYRECFCRIFFFDWEKVKNCFLTMQLLVEKFTRRLNCIKMDSGKRHTRNNPQTKELLIMLYLRIH